MYLKKAMDIFKRLIILFDDDEFTDLVGVSQRKKKFSFEKLILGERFT